MTWLRERAAAGFRDRFGREPAFLVRAPGRVNLLGGHIDYSDGVVLPVAIDRAVWLAAAPADGKRVRVATLDLKDYATFSLDGLAPGALDGWIAYPKGVAWVLQNAGYELSGLDAVLSSDVPIAVGLSSSAAVEVAFGLAWATLDQLAIDRGRLAGLCQRAENEFVGVGCGIMDQMVSLLGRADHIMSLDCRTLDAEHVPLPDEVAIVISDTGVRRRLTQSNYNNRRAECQDAVHLLRRYLPEITALRDVSATDLVRLGHLLPDSLQRRVRHVVTEIARVLDGAQALRAGDLQAFGAAVNASHLSSRHDYESTIFELDVLAEAAWAVEGCYGARLSGAGFGGCTLSLVHVEAVERFTQHVSAAYVAAVGREPTVYVCRTADGAEVVKDRTT
jgi:galactokinase